MTEASSSLLRVSALALVVALAGCGDEATIKEADGYGKTPTLPPPKSTLFPR